MKFSEIQYRRPDVAALETKFQHLLSIFETADSFEEQDALMKDINVLRMEFQTMGTLASIHYSIDTTSKENEDEQDFFDAYMPIYEGLVHRYYSCLIKSKFRHKLEAKWGKQLFEVAEVTARTFSPEIVEDLQRENELRTDYTKLLASAKIFFDGEERNLAGGPRL